MVDKEAIMDNLESGTFGIADLEDYLTLFLKVCNESEDVQEEVEDWNRKLVIKLSDTDNFWLKIDEGKFSSGKGDAADGDVTLEMTGETAAGVFTAEVDATSAYMSGDLKIIGPLPDAVKFRTLTELVREELEE